jgi:hypothetical protein
LAKYRGYLRVIRKGFWSFTAQNPSSTSRGRT